MTVIKAVIFMPEEELRNAALIARCFEQISRSGYVFDSIVSDWQQLMDMLRSGAVQVVIYARPEHIDPSWTPRFELAEEGPAGPGVETAQGEAPRSGGGGRRARRPRIVG